VVLTPPGGGKIKMTKNKKINKEWETYSAIEERGYEKAVKIVKKQLSNARLGDCVGILEKLKKDSH